MYPQWFSSQRNYIVHGSGSQIVIHKGFAVHWDSADTFVSIRIQILTSDKYCYSYLDCLQADMRTNFHLPN